MADIYQVDGPGGIFEIESDHPPTPQEVLRAVRAHGDAVAAQEQQRLQQSASPEQKGSAVGRFASNAWDVLNPVSMAKGLYHMAADPLDTLTNIYQTQAQEAKTAADAFRSGEYSRAGGHGLAAIVPLVGPVAAQAGEQLASGDVAGAMGKGGGLLLPFGIAGGAKIARGVTAKAAPTLAARAAQALDEGAASRVVDVMAPKVGANKTRFGGMAEKVAPDLLKKGDAAAWSREGLHSNVQEGLAQAEKALDEAANNRLSARAFPTRQIVADLMAKRARLTAESVEGSRTIPEYQGKGVRGARVTDNPATTEFTTGPDVAPSDLPRHALGYRTLDTGEFAQEPPRVGRPIGKDVQPAPNAARIAAIDQAIKEVRQLGPVARYESLRRIREAWDGPAKQKYSPSMTADFLKHQGYANGAADVTGVLRESLARFDPETATANASYSIYRTANDVLDATAEVERTRPKVGRQIMARLTGAVVGGQTAGSAGAIGGFVLGPALDAAVSAGATTKLQLAQVMTRLAEAIRKGDAAQVDSMASQLQRISKRASVVNQLGNVTSPSESQIGAAPASVPAR